MTLTIDAVVPLRWPGEPKRRLGGLLSVQQRRALSLAMVSDVCATLAKTPGIRAIAIVAPGPLPKSCQPPGAQVLVSQATGYSAAARAGVEAAADRGAAASLVLPSDLPLLSVADVGRLIGAIHEHDVVLAPDRFGYGTNVLGVRSTIAFPFQFGERSFRRHMQATIAGGWSVEILRSRALGHDVDRPIDLIDLPASGRLRRDSNTAKLLARWQLNEVLTPMQQPVGL